MYYSACVRLYKKKRLIFVLSICYNVSIYAYLLIDNGFVYSSVAMETVSICLLSWQRLSVYKPFACEVENVFWHRPKNCSSFSVCLHVDSQQHNFLCIIHFGVCIFEILSVFQYFLEVSCKFRYTEKYTLTFCKVEIQISKFKRHIY